MKQKTDFLTAIFFITIFLLLAFLTLGFLIPYGTLAIGLPPSQAANARIAKQSSSKEAVTVPLHIEFNRPFVDLEFTRPDGTPRQARFWVDTGGGGFILTEPLAKELNLKLGAVFTEGGEKLASIEPPAASIGGMTLDLQGARSFVAIGSKTLAPGVNAEGLFPGHLLMRYHVIFDYPGRKFTLAKPGALKPRGVRVPSPISKPSGFPRIELQIGGETFGFLLDTGASYTMISQELLTRWAEQHKDWKRATGAVGEANMGLGMAEANALQLRVAEAQFANRKLTGFGAIARPKGTFETYMSRMMTAPIVGAIGGNILSAFRIEIDYQNGVTYVEKRRAINSFDADMVGLTLQAKPDGSYTIVAVSSQTSKAMMDQIKPNDKLLKVARLDVTNQPLAKVIDALRGKVNEKRALVLERDGKQFTAVTTVVRIL